LATTLATADDGGAVELAADHPTVRALGAGDSPEALAILAAHVLGASVRGNDDAASSEAHAILALLVTR
ncbi:MAG: hypothetical protein M3Y87_28720, partial [Myxococcota bacterium]|nr:hypothetical protein [Myxococcota bacterium]